MQIVLAVVIFAACGIVMGIGLWSRGRCLRGSCGTQIETDGESLRCGGCPHRQHGSEEQTAAASQSRDDRNS